MNADELPRLGDRVRVTYEGTVLGRYMGSLKLDTVEGWIKPHDNPVIEILSPPLPPEPAGNTLVRDRHGAIWQCGGGKWDNLSCIYASQQWSGLVKNHGPLTVYRAEL